MLAAIRAVKPRRVTTAGVRRAAADGRRLMGRAPTVRELAAALGVSAEEIADAHLDPLTGPRSLPAPMARASIANARLDPRRPS